MEGEKDSWDGKGRSTKAQSSIEFLIIFSVVLVAFIVLFALVLQQGADVTKRKTGIDASNTVSELDAAARSVYAQGEGAKKKVFITIPDGFESNSSSISGKLIKMRVNGNDYAMKEPFDVYGSFPMTTGNHWIWVISEGSRVRIGTAMLAVDRETINTLITSNNTRDEFFTVYNIWNDTVNVTLTRDWNNPNVSLGLSSYSFSLSAGGKSSIDTNFATSNLANGFYTGSIIINGSDFFNNTDSLTIPLSLEVTAEEGLGPPLTVYPPVFSASMMPNTTVSQTFEICTNINTSLSAVLFAPSINPPGTWAGGTTPILNMGPASCVSKNIWVSVPAGTALGNYSGFIYVSGNDTPGAEDTIALAITVGGSLSDSQGPAVRNITVYPTTRKKYVQDSIVIKATGDDSTTGNNSISGCSIRADGGAWQVMSPSDGAFNRPVENATYNYFSGFTMGNHTVGVKCTDAKNNTGAEVNATFKIYKEFLFVKANTSPNTNEGAWINWISLDLSNEGYAWNIDTVNSSDFIAGNPSLTYYSTIVAEEWVPGMQTRMNSFVSSNGSIVILGNALTDGPNALVGCAGSSSSPVNQTQINIVSNSHYITLNISTGNVVVGNVSQPHGRFWKNCGMNPVLAHSFDDPTHYDELGIAGNRLFWGPVTPNNLSEIGLNITIRTLDFAINTSKN